MNRRQLIAYARSQGFTGEAKPDALRKWLEEQGHDTKALQAKNADGDTITVDFDVAWKRIPAIETTADAKPDGQKSGTNDDLGDDLHAMRARQAELERKVREAEAKAEADFRVAKASDGDGVEGKGNKTTMVQTPEQWHKSAERKGYDLRASRGETNFPSHELAETFGANFRLTVAKKMNFEYADKKSDLDILKKTAVVYDNTLGGFLVPREMDSYFIDIKTSYGVARQLFRPVKCNDAGIDIPKRTGGFTVYSPAEAAAITASSMTVGSVHVAPIKMAALGYISKEMLRSSALDIGEISSKEMAYAFAKAEDQCFLVGDGTATYFGITGIVTALYNLSGTVANIAGVVVQGSSNTWSAQVIGDLEAVYGRLEDKQNQLGNLKWLCHRRYWAEVIVRLVKASGGETSMMFEGRPTNMLFGDPVVTANAMPRVTATTGLFLLYGDFRSAGTIADVAGVEIASSEHYAFNQDLLAIRATQKVGFAAHDVGNASATQADRVPGPVVGLATA